MLFSLLRKKNYSRGFTLVELLVVITMIGILTSLLIVFINPSKQLQKAKDIKRVQDFKQIQSALDTYYNDNNCYPATFSFNTSFQQGSAIYMKNVPQDQDCASGGSCYQYVTDTTSICPQWNVLFSKIVNKPTNSISCALEQIPNCLPLNYNTAGYDYCGVSGKVDCSKLSLLYIPTSGGSQNVPTATPIPTNSPNTPTPTTPVVPTPTPTNVPTPTPTTSPCGTVANVPTSIDSTGATDVTAALNNWIASVPDCRTIVFPAGKTYHLNQGIQIANRHNLIFDGNGSTLRAYGAASNNLSSPFAIGHTYGGFWAGGNTYITIHNFNIVGNSPTPGVFGGGEQESAIVFDGGSNLEAYGNTISAVFGDGLYVGSGVNGVSYHDNHIITAGRNGFSSISSTNVVIENNQFDKVGYVTFDIEPNTSSEPSSFITIRNNTGGTWGQEFFALDGSHTGASIHDITVTGNVMTGKPLTTIVNNGHTTRNANIIFTNNTSNVSATGPVLMFYYVDGLTVTGNVQPLNSGSLASMTSCTNVTYVP